MDTNRNTVPEAAHRAVSTAKEVLRHLQTLAKIGPELGRLHGLSRDVSSISRESRRLIGRLTAFRERLGCAIVDQATAAARDPRWRGVEEWEIRVVEDHDAWSSVPLGRDGQFAEILSAALDIAAGEPLSPELVGREVSEHALRLLRTRGAEIGICPVSLDGASRLPAYVVRVAFGALELPEGAPILRSRQEVSRG